MKSRSFGNATEALFFCLCGFQRGGAKRGLSCNCINISGITNRYGHPGKETIARLDSLSIEHLCTIEKGQIKVFEKNGILDLETMSG